MALSLRWTLVPIAVACLLLPASGCTSSDDGTATPDPDGSLADSVVVTPDGAVVAPDGAVVAPDGAVVTPDGAVVTPDVASLPTTAEQEPNDGATVTELNDVQVPGTITGGIGTDNDTDIFRFAGKAGDRLLISVVSTGDLQPHLAVLGEPPMDVPVVVNRGPGDLIVEVYLLETGNHLLGIRDRRNLGSSPAGVGGPTFGYEITVTPLSRAPIPLSAGKVPSTLDPAGTVRVFSFDAKTGDEVTLEVFAARLGPPSDVDSRLTLFHPGQGAWLGTNDNPGLSELDALLHASSLPFNGPYHAIVENVAESGADFGFELELTKN